MIYVNMTDGSEYKTEEEARDSIIETIDFSDLTCMINNNITYEDLIKELARLVSPLYYQLLDEAIEDKFDNYITTMDEYEEG